MKRGRLVITVALSAVVIGLLLIGRWLLGTPATTLSPVVTDYLVVVGTESHHALTEADRVLLDAGTAEIGILRIPTGADQCAAAAWASIAAGRVVDTGAICHPEVTPDGAVGDWRELQRRADGRLGGLAGTGGPCVAAVGPGAALGAARPDGTVAMYQTFEQSGSSGRMPTCPVTFVDAPSAPEAAELIAELAKRDDITLLVAGLGPDDGGESPQLLYRTPSEVPGLITGADAIRPGTIELADLEQAIRRHLADPVGTATNAPGFPLSVVAQATSTQTAIDLLAETRVLADPGVRAGMVVGSVALTAVLLIAAGLVGGSKPRGGEKLAVTLIGGAAMLWPAALLTAGIVPWWRMPHPWGPIGIVAGMLLVGAGIVAVGRRLTGWSGWRIGALVTVATGLVHAGLGAPWRTGSLLDRPDIGDRTIGSAAITVTVVGLLLVVGHLGRVNRGIRLLGAPWLLLLAAAVGALAISWRVGFEPGELLLVLVGLAAWTIIHSWLAPGRPEDAIDHRALRVPALIVVVGVAMSVSDPAWAWMVGSVFFAVSAGSAQLVR